MNEKIDRNDLIIQVHGNIYSLFQIAMSLSTAELKDYNKSLLELINSRQNNKTSIGNKQQ